MSNAGPVAKLRVLLPSDRANGVVVPTLLVAVRAKILGQERWKERLIRMLAHLMPGLRDVHVPYEFDNEFQLAFTHSNTAVTNLWHMATVVGLNKQIAGIPRMFHTDGKMPIENRPMVQWIRCASKVTDYDLQALLRAECVDHAVVSDDPAYNGTVILAHLNDTSSGSGYAGNRRKQMDAALAFVPFS